MEATEPPPRRLLHFARALILIYAAAAMLAGLALGFIAWKLPSQACAMLALILLLSAPMLALQASLPLPAELVPHGDAIDRIDRCLRLARFCRAHVGVACAGVLIQWISQWMGLIKLHELLAFSTATCVIAATACMPWLASCEMRLHGERDAYRRWYAETAGDMRH
jgi:hypothetical protein